MLARERNELDTRGKKLKDEKQKIKKVSRARAGISLRACKIFYCDSVPKQSGTSEREKEKENGSK